MGWTMSRTRRVDIKIAAEVRAVPIADQTQ